MSEFDHFVKFILGVKFYARYTDDFVIISQDKMFLRDLIAPTEQFLIKRLKLNLHPKKIVIRKYVQGVDFLGYIILPHAKLTRKKTWRRAVRKFNEKLDACRAGKISREKLRQSLQSYLGTLSHADSYKQKEYLLNRFWLG